MTKAVNVAHPAVRTLRPVTGRDLRSLPLSPREAFLLSRIEGAMNEADLCALSGFDAATIATCVDHLASLGAITIEGPLRDHERASHPVFVGAPPSSGANPRVSQTQMKPPLVPGESDGVDLDPERRRTVDELHAKMNELDYYALLGVPETADRKEIKRAYYALAPNYHPDKFYGKNLGPFKPKMEAVFAQITFAYETLSSADRRAEYDGYLSAQKQTRSMEELLQAASAAETLPGPMSDAHPVAPTPSDRIPLVQSGAVSVRSKELDRARREALARKLGITRSSIPPADYGVSVPPTSSQASQRAAAEELKRRHDAVAGDSRRSQARRYVEAGAAALSSNPAAAANAYRLALTLDPNNPEIMTAHREAARLAAVALADGYLRQAEYESRNGQWLEAARSYAKAAAGMQNDAIVQQKAAEALLKSSGDMHQAADFAKKAVALAPKRLEPRLALIEVYAAAGLPLAAKRELEHAREIAPGDDRIKELSKRLK